MTHPRPIDRPRKFLAVLVLGAILTASIAPSMALAQDAGPRHGGRAVIALISEPDQLNRFFTASGGSALVHLVQEPLFRANAAGDYQPVLAAEIPTLANGGISADFLTITYRLRDGIHWSDGQPLTADDLLFTFEAIRDPESTPTGPLEAFASVESVTVLDPLTIEVTMAELNPGFLELWRYILPRHGFDSTAVSLEHPQARTPLGTGPFVIREWRAGDQIVFDRNPNYWLDPDKPYLDGITVQVTPDRTSAISAFLAGEFDLYHFVSAGDLATLVSARDAGAPIVVNITDQATQIEWLYPNVGFQGDPNTPHPVLGDVSVRAAIDHAIDRQTIIDEVLGGFAMLEGSILMAGMFRSPVPPAPYDPERAIELLEQAGWEPGPDGVRVKDGVRASIEYMTTTGSRTRELIQQVVQQNLRDVGIETFIQNRPNTVIFASWIEGGLARRGEFDMYQGQSGFALNPYYGYLYRYHGSTIPSEENQAGITRSFNVDPELDAMIDAVRNTLDIEVQREISRELADYFAEMRYGIPLYANFMAGAWSEQLRGVSMDYFESDSPHLHSAADWYFAE